MAQPPPPPPPPPPQTDGSHAWHTWHEPPSAPQPPSEPGQHGPPPHPHSGPGQHGPPPHPHSDPGQHQEPKPGAVEAEDIKEKQKEKEREREKEREKKEKAKAIAVARQTQHSKELINAFKPIKYFLTIIGQMPFIIKPKKDGTYSFKFYRFSGQVFIYFIMFFLSTGMYLLLTLGIISFIMDSIFSYIKPTHDVIVKDKTSGTSEILKWERYMVRNEMVSMIVVWSWLTVACAGSLYIVTNSKYYVHYMNYFNRVVQIMDMDMTPGVSAYLFVNNLLSLAVASLLILAFVIGCIIDDFTAVTSPSSVISNFILRLFKLEIETNEDNKFWYQLMGFFIMVYALFASRANVIQFLFFSQLLKNGSKIWNERLRKVLTHETTIEEDDQYNRRLEARLIYKDHLMIVQLYQMTENVFGTILFSYYSLTIISVVMELYQLAALQGFADNETLKKKDPHAQSTKLIEDRMGSGTGQEDTTHEHEVLATAAVSFLLLTQNVIFCYRTTVDAAKAYEYAMKGFDILRRHGLMYCRNKTDRNFVLSLYFSFAKNNPLQLTAGGYFAVNKVLLVTMSSTVVNWAISIYQTKVDQWK